MDMESHGGYCCGMRHLYGFNEGDDTTLRHVKGFLKRSNQTVSGAADIEAMRIYEETQAVNRKRGKIIEVVLTDDQIQRMPKTCNYLKEYGFKLVHRFDNSTGSICNVLHYCFSTLPNDQSPFENLPKVEETPVVEPERETGRLPQVGEVWRINNNTYSRDEHCYRKNTFVRITDNNLQNGCRVRVENIHLTNGRDYPYSQLVALDDISFIRSEV